MDDALTDFLDCYAAECEALGVEPLSHDELVELVAALLEPARLH